MRIKALSAALVFGLAACGGDAGEPAPQAAPSTDTPADQVGLQEVEWFQVDHDAQTVTIDLVAGATSAVNYWNFNGLYGGRGEIVVPEGYTVTVNLTNSDPAMGHSVGVGERMSSYPQSFQNPEAVFAGAMTSNPTSMTESTLPGETETITFVASAAGEYAFICYVVGHAATGMYINLTVSTDGEAGVTL